MARTYQWLNKSNIRANTIALIMAVQEQAFNTRSITAVQDLKCRWWKQPANTVAYIISGWSKLTETECTEKHENVASIVYWALCAEDILEGIDNWWVEPKKSSQE